MSIVRAASFFARFAVVALAAAACASPAEPPGGPPDTIMPQLVHTSPDSGRVQYKTREVTFSFDEVVAETPRGAQTLSSIVLVSPMDGEPIVDWKRSNISVHARRGWRANTTYVVTLLPGITDLKGNARDSTNVVVFTTGDSIARTRIMGIAFDWVKGTVAPRASISAHPDGDTTLIFVTETDSSGRFTLPFLPSGGYVVRALMDGNRNRAVDPREQWDSLHVALKDTSSIEFYAFSHDSEPRLRSITPVDSVTLRLTFDQALSPDSGYVPAIEIRTTDSTVVPIASISTYAALSARRDARARITRDSIAAADTSTVRRAARQQAIRDSIERAATIADSIARDPVKRIPPPKPRRPMLINEIAVELKAPLTVGTRYIAYSRAKGVIGIERNSTQTFSRPKPAPPVNGPPVKKDSLDLPSGSRPPHRP